VDAIVSGTHEPATSHHGLLRAFVDEAVLQRMDRALEANGYRTHEFGDSVLIEGALLRAAHAGRTSAPTHAPAHTQAQAQAQAQTHAIPHTA